MKRRLNLGFLLLALAAPGWALAEPVGRIFDLSGEVTLTRKGQAGVAAKKDDRFSEGDTVRTGKGASFVQLNFTDASVVKLGPNSELVITIKSKQPTKVGFFRKKIKMLDTTKLDLNFGKALVKVEGFSKRSASFEVRTPTAVAGVRGTLFIREFIPAGAAGAQANAGRLAFAGAPVRGMLFAPAVLAQAGRPGGGPIDRCTCFQGRVDYRPRNVPRPRVQVIRAGHSCSMRGNQNPPKTIRVPKKVIQKELENFGVSKDKPLQGDKPKVKARKPEGGGKRGPRGAQNPRAPKDAAKDARRQAIKEAKEKAKTEGSSTGEGKVVPLPSAVRLPKPPDPPGN